MFEFGTFTSLGRYLLLNRCCLPLSRRHSLSDLHRQLSSVLHCVEEQSPRLPTIVPVLSRYKMFEFRTFTSLGRYLLLNRCCLPLSLRHSLSDLHRQLCGVLHCVEEQIPVVVRRKDCASAVGGCVGVQAVLSS